MLNLLKMVSLQKSSTSVTSKIYYRLIMRVLARPYLMTLYVIFPGHYVQVCFKSYSLKKTLNCFTLLEKVFFQKDAFMILYIHVVFDLFFHFIMICSYFSCFFIYHLSTIFAVARSTNAFFIFNIRKGFFL